MFGVVRAQGDPFLLVPALREIVRSTDPDLPMHDIKTMPQRVRDSLQLRAMYSWMFGMFGLTAAVMAFAGIYGVVSFWVGQRIQEIGIRMALGARAPDVIRMVIGQGLRLIGVGLGLGLFGAVALGRLLASTLYDLSPTDPPTYVCVGLLLLGTGVLACYLPARWAARIDPMVALRYE
jgi:putative ABC transport system permease protein